MARRNGNDTGGVLLLVLIVIILPIMLYYWLFKSLIVAGVKIAEACKKAKINKQKKTTVVNRRPVQTTKPAQIKTATTLSEAPAMDDLELYATIDMIDELDREEQEEMSEDEKYTQFWEEHCESCGELLEDCTCDWKEQSMEDISQGIDDDIDQDEDGGLSFDSFESFDEDDDF